MKRFTKVCLWIFGVCLVLGLLLVSVSWALGFRTLLPDEQQSPVITSFYYPADTFDFKAFYQALKAKGFVIYPGKISQADTFRIGNIGDVHPADFVRLIQAVKELQAQ